MKVRTLVLTGALYGCALVTTTTTAVASPVPSPVDDARQVQLLKDPATGLDVRVTVGGSADVSIEVGDRTVRIEKQLIGRTAVTRLITPTESLTLAVDARTMTVSGSLGHAQASQDRRGSLAAVRHLLQQSEAVRQAIRLLGRLDLGPRSPAGHALLSTRAMLLTEIGDPRGGEELGRWIRSAQQAIALTPVSLQTGPGDCWATYTKEALATWAELEDCLKGVKWYDVGAEFVCGALYDLRAIGAFSWYLHCVALR